MKSELIREVLKVVRKEKIINKIIGILNRKTYHSGFISQVVTIDDVMNLSTKYLQILDDKHYFKSVELGVPGKDFEPDQLIYIEYSPESKIIGNEKKNRLCIFSVIPKKNFFSKYFGKIEEDIDQSELIVVFNSRIVFKSCFPSVDLDYHKRVYNDLDLLHISPGPYSHRDMIIQLYASKKGKPINQKEHSEELENVVNKYLNGFKAIDNINLINIAQEFYSSISIAKLNDGWVEGIELILKHEFLQDIAKYREVKRKNILDFERVQNNLYCDKIRTLQTTEENFDLGRFKK